MFKKKIPHITLPPATLWKNWPRGRFFENIFFWNEKTKHRIYIIEKANKLNSLITWSLTFCTMHCNVRILLQRCIVALWTHLETLWQLCNHHRQFLSHKKTIYIVSIVIVCSPIIEQTWQKLLILCTLLFKSKRY